MKKTIWIFCILLFVVPEILWSPILNIIDSFLQNSNSVEILRPNFLMDSDNYNYLLVVLTLQEIGLIGILISTIRTPRSYLKIIIAPLIFLLLVITTLVLLAGIYMRNGISF